MKKITVTVKKETLKFFQEKIDGTSPPEVLLSQMLELFKAILLQANEHK